MAAKKDNPKPIYTSRLGLLGFAVAALGVLQELNTVDWATVLAHHQTLAGFVAVGLGGAITVLRLYTNSPTSLTGK